MELNVKTIENGAEELWRRAVAEKYPLPPFTARYERYESPDNYAPLSDWFTFSVGDTWDCARRTTLRMRTSAAAPELREGFRLALRINVQGEGSVKVNGRALETISATPSGEETRGIVALPDEMAGKTLDIEVEACMNFGWCNRIVYKDENAVIPAKFERAEFLLIDRAVEELYYDVRNVCDAAELSADDRARRALLGAATSALADSDDPKRGSAKIAGTVGAFAPSDSTVDFVGQAHIDTAWLWTIRESVRKCARTFSNVLGLMDRYPEFTFAFSQPYLFRTLEKNYPELFEKVKRRVAEGRIELVGNAWVEMDTNMPSGESLVRQLLYGREYYLRAFGRDSKVFWMPDVFGYSWALPQIMKRSGVEYFFTSKLVNNDTNRFPHSLFMWRGVDGTPILSYLQRLNYNGMLNAKTLREIDSLFDQRDVTDECLMTFGYGDGGGGPTEDMLQKYKRLKSFPGLPKANMTTAEAFFRHAEKSQAELPEWDDEMYYENHRGTYTSQAEIKKCNRRMEQLLRKLEIACVTAKVYLSEPYPADEISELWREMLVLQFHDILPGSSQGVVYRECRETYSHLFARAQALMDGVMAKLAKASPAGHDTWNFRPWAENGVPPCCNGALSRPEGTVFVSKNRIENELLLAELDDDGLLARVYDKECRREVLLPGEKGNLLTVFVDKPERESAWNIDATYQNEYEELTKAQSVSIIEGEDGAKRIRVVRVWQSSTITQDIALVPGSKRLDFITKVDWHARERMLKCSFPVTVRAHNATYEIQFGAIERPTHRNTSYDRAKFEVSGHRFADLSEGGYGVSLLNDCKYGYDILGSRMRLTLLRSPNYPDPNADEGMHEFAYSLFPHEGDWRNGTVREANRLNIPLETHAAGGGDKVAAPVAWVMSDHTALDTLKWAEDGRGAILRVYECCGARGDVTVRCGAAPARVAECDLMERDERELAAENDSFTFFIKPYEIKTFRLQF